MPTQRSSKRTERGPERDARRAVRRADFLEAADRVVRRDGPAASMDKIAAEAGIAKPVLYRYFGDKGGLYRALAQRYVEELVHELRGGWEDRTDPRARISATIDGYLAFIEREREAYRFLMHRAVPERPEAQATVGDFIRQVANEVAVVVGEELRRAGLDSGAAEPWAHGMVGMVHMAGDWWLEHKTMPRDTLVSYLVTLLWNGFAGLPAAAVGARPESESA